MSSFHERQKSLFDQLKSAEDQYSFCKTNKADTSQDYGTINKQVYRKLKHEMKQFRGRESIFKRVEDANIRDCLRPKTAPDFLKNPQKWVYYSLADVTPDQMSDKTNTATALAILRDLEARNDHKNEDTDETGAVFKKPVFQVSKTITEMPPNDEDQQIVFKCNKFIMPEYEVGVSSKKNKKHKIPKSKETQQNISESNKVELKLNHLYEDDADDNAS